VGRGHSEHEGGVPASRGEKANMERVLIKPMHVRSAWGNSVVVWALGAQYTMAFLLHELIRSVASFNMQGITRIACHSTQPLVLTACLDGAVRVWDLRTGECMKTFMGHADGVQAIVLSPDCNLVLSCSEDRSARIFSLL
jgi:WD40 repeat protein